MTSMKLLNKIQTSVRLNLRAHVKPWWMNLDAKPHARVRVKDFTHR
jgi:hypothetical protein